MNESLNNSLNKSLRNWSRDSELLKDIMELAKKYLLTFNEAYDLWELDNIMPKYIKQVHQANIITNIFVLLFDEIFQKHSLDIMGSLSIYANNELTFE
jgi:hypothetical protein